MNVIKKGFRYALRKLYIRKRPDFLTEYKKIVKRDPTYTGTENIIVAPFTFDNNHLFEAIYARKAMFEGKNVHSFFCGQGVKYCEKRGSGFKNHIIRCELCLQMQYEFVNDFNVKPCYIAQEITTQDKAEISNYITAFYNDEYKSSLFMGVNVNKVLLSALQRYYFEAEPSMTCNIVTTGFLETILSTVIVFDKLCKRVNPEYVLVSHGTYSSWGSILEYCKAQEIPVVVWGRVYNKLGIYLANDNSYLTEMVTCNNEEWVNKELTTDQEAMIIDFLDMRTGKNNIEFVYDYNKHNKKLLTKNEICKELNIPSESIIVGMFPSIPWDGSVFGVSEAFSRYREWISTTIDFFKNKQDVYLLIRTHPAEKASSTQIGNETLQTMINQMFKTLPQNVIIIPADSKINSFAVGKAAIFGIFYCSTVGMELTYLGVPLICAGPSPLKNKNIVYDAINESHYINLLKCGVNEELLISNKNRENLIKYSFYDTFTRVMPETFVEFEEGSFKRLLFDDEKMIQENKVLQYLYETINNRGAYNFDRFYP